MTMPLIATMKSWQAVYSVVEEVEHVEDVLRVRARTGRRSSRCPRCQELASRRHSFYTRQLADLPCFGAENQVRVRCQRFFCDNDGCEQQIFCERLHGVASVYARKSQRLHDYLSSIAFALGGKAGAALAKAGRDYDERNKPIATYSGHDARTKSHPESSGHRRLVAAQGTQPQHTARGS